MTRFRLRSVLQKPSLPFQQPSVPEEGTVRKTTTAQNGSERTAMALVADLHQNHSGLISVCCCALAPAKKSVNDLIVCHPAMGGHHLELQANQSLRRVV